MKIAPTLTETALEIALSLFNEGRYGDARIVLTEALANKGACADNETLRLKIRLAVVEQWDGNLDEAEALFSELKGQVDACDNPLLQGRYYYNRQYLLRRRGNRDEAIISLTAASYYYDLAHEPELCADAENNLGILLVDAGRIGDAHEHFDKAMKGCRDSIKRAQMCESQAAAYLAEGRPLDALPYARQAVELVEGTERHPLLEAHVGTLGKVCAALERQFKIEKEKPIIESALREAGGRSTAAARILNITRRTLDYKLETQHQDLLYLRAEKLKARGVHASKARRRSRKVKTT